MTKTTANKKLGRGLSALIGESKMVKESAPINGEKLKSVELIDMTKIIPGIYQPRRVFDEEKLAELSESIAANGLIQPIILRKIDDENNYEIIAGERRFRAAKLAKLVKIPAIVKKINNHEALEMAIVENTQRSDLSPIEEAAGYQQLINDFSYSQEKVAKRVGKSRSHIANLLRLLSLPKSIQDLLNKGDLSAGHARAIINSSNPQALAQAILNNQLTVREAEDLARKDKNTKREPGEKAKAKDFEKNTINDTHVRMLEHDLCELTNMKAKISYNAVTDNGRITIKFDSLEDLEELVKRL